ncbi:MAG: response regulator [Caldithrix sp.]|nr:response regulator [Caldithrix sp.]
MIRVIIADDHPLIRDGLKKRIDAETDMNVTAEAQNADELLEMLGETECDVVLIDISMPGKSGLELIQEVRQWDQDIKFLVLSIHPEEQFAARAIKSGANGYITKDSPPREIIKAIHKIMDNRTYVSESFAENLAMGLTKDPDKAPHDNLSDREFQILRLLGMGKTITGIAEELFLSQSSVNTYRRRILKKLNVETTAELIHYAIKNDLIE